MKVFAGTYGGLFVCLEGEPNNLTVKTTQQVSENSLRAIAISHGEVILGGYDQELRAVNYNNGIQTKQSKQSLAIINKICKINDKFVAVGLENGNIRFFDSVNWCSRKDLKEHKKGITDIKVDKNGLLMVSVGGRQMIFWNINTQKSLYHYKFQFDLQHLLLVDSFQYLFLLGERTIRQMSTTDNKQLFKVDLNEKIQCGLVYLNFLIIGTEKGQIKIWNHGNFDHCIHFQAHDTRIKDMKNVKHDDVDYLITADSNGTISVWDILQFLNGVDNISQDYPLSGLTSLYSIKTHQRIICIEALGNSDIQQPKQEQKAKKSQEVEQKDEKCKNTKKNKQIYKQQHHQKKKGKLLKKRH